MFRAIREKWLGRSKSSPHRKALRRSPSQRRLNFENLECRALLSGSNPIGDSSFEVPALATGGILYNANGSPWTFSGTAGVTSNASAFTVSNPPAPDGTQVAFLQDFGSASQSVYLAAGTYSLSFMAAQRAGASQAHSQEIQVLVDGNQVGIVTPTGSNYGSYQTSNFWEPTGTHTIKFVGLNPSGGDNTAFVDEVSIAVQADSISDGSFEMPALAVNTYAYSPNGSPWNFTGTAGVAANASAFTASNPIAADGTQVGFLQETGGMSQSLYLDSGTYSITFLAAQRGGSSQKHPQEIQVLVDGNQVALVTPTSGNYGSYQTANFWEPAGTHTIKFVGINPLGGDCTAFVDSVAIAAEADEITDGCFQTPSLVANSWQYAPGGSPWSFTGTAGIATNASGFTTNNYSPPVGAEVGFVQDTGAISQSLYLDTGTYSLSYLAVQRGAPYQSHYQELEIEVDGNEVGMVTPVTINYATYQTADFTVPAGTHVIKFLGINPAGGDNTAFIEDVALTAQSDAISDGSFEAPALAAGTYQGVPNGSSAWVFSGMAGISANGSAFTGNNAPAPAGSQVAYLQDAGVMSQSLYLDGGTYSLSFDAAQREGSAQQDQEIQIQVDGNVVGLITPGSTAYGAYQTPSFTIASGQHTVRFAGLNPAGGDNTAFIDLVAIKVLDDAIADNSFEVPTLVAGTYQYAPTGAAWQFAGTAGVAANGSSFVGGNPAAPDGAQVAFLQGTGSMSQTLYLDTGTYDLSFQAAQRAGASQAQYQEFEVLVDGTEVGLITPTSSKYGTYETSSFTVTAGTHTVKFVGLNPAGGDNTALIDVVQI